MSEKTVSAVDSVKAKAEEVAAFLETLQTATPTEARLLASAKRDIAGGFKWAQRAIDPEHTQ